MEKKPYMLCVDLDIKVTCCYYKYMSNLKIKIIQTSDNESGYKTLMDKNRVVNEIYCKKMGYEYMAYQGIKRGYHPWQATFNRIYLMEDELNKKEADWVFYIDADVVVADLDRRLEDIIYEGNNSTMSFIFCKGCENVLYDINAGVFFMNVSGAFSKSVITMWRELFESICTTRILYLAKHPWSIHSNSLLIQDQSLLEFVFRIYDTFGVLQGFLKTYMGADANKFNYDGNFVRQSIRPHQGRNGPDIDNRVRLAHMEASRILDHYGFDSSVLGPDLVARPSPSPEPPAPVQEVPPVAVPEPPAPTPVAPTLAPAAPTIAPAPAPAPAPAKSTHPMATFISL